MADHRGGSTDVALIQPEIFTDILLEADQANKVAGAFFWNLDHLYNPAQRGKTYDLPKSAVRTARQKVIETAISYDRPAFTQKQITIDKHPYNATLIEDAVDAITQTFLTSSDVREMTEAVALDFDSSLLDQYASLTGTTVAATTDTGSNLYNHFVEAFKNLNKAKAPRMGRAWIVDTEMEARLLDKDSKFINFDYLKDTSAPVRTGMLGMILGSPVLVTTQVPNATDPSGVTTHQGFYGHFTAYAHMHAFGPRYTIDRIPEQVGFQHMVDRFYGVAVPRSDRGLNFTYTT